MGPLACRPHNLSPSYDSYKVAGESSTPENCQSSDPYTCTWLHTHTQTHTTMIINNNNNTDPYIHFRGGAILISDKDELIVFNSHVAGHL